MANPSPPSSSMEVERNQEPDGNQLVLPDDGYEWKKYGQKYTIRISKNRSYFKCRKKNCTVKKIVEWPPSDPSNIKIVYKGGHNHPPRPDHEASGSNQVANPYELGAQVFGPPSGTS